MVEKLKTAEEIRKDIEALKNKSVDVVKGSTVIRESSDDSVSTTKEPFLDKVDGNLPSDEPVKPEVQKFEHALSTEEKNAQRAGVSDVEEQKEEERPVGSINTNQPGVDKSEESLLSNHLVGEAAVNPPTLRGMTTRNERIAEVLKLHSSDSQQYEKSYRMILSILDEFGEGNNLDKR